MKYLFYLLILTLSFFTMSSYVYNKEVANNPSSSKSQPIELGKVNWERDLTAGLSSAENSDKPIFILFQEVPGCSTCQNYGQDVLSHPLIVEAIQTEFIPVAIYNNKGGEDAKILKQFGEPSWNNPVVRIVNTNKKDIVSRVSGNYSKLGIVTAMIDALTLSQIQVPEYLNLLKREFEGRTNGLKNATLSMYCFWTGEKQLAKMDGVVETQPGFMGGKEVVQVKYDPTKIEYGTIIKQGQQSAGVSHVFSSNKNEIVETKEIIGNKVSEIGKFRLDADPKYYLSKTEYQYIPMTPLQQALVNSEIGNNSNPDFLLSPWQLAYLKQSNTKKQSMINVDLTEAWEWQ